MRQLSIRLFKRTDWRTEIVLQYFFPFHHLTYSNTKILRTERLCYIHLCSGRKSLHLLFHLMPSGNYDNRNMRRLFHQLNPSSQFNATDARHHDIANNHIRINLIHHLLQAFGILQCYYIKVAGKDLPNKP